MNILFLTIGDFDSIETRSIYSDLLRCFRNHGHNVYVIAPYEKRTGKKTELIDENGAHILHIETGDVTGASNLIRKGIAQISVEPIFINGIKRYFSNVKFDLILYSTPPITFAKVVEYVKKRDSARTYLLLKDIFPQNAVDLGMMTTTGPKGLIYKFFRAKERKLYAISDRIGCMSQANVDYVLENNPEIDPGKVEICPNCVEVVDMSVDEETRRTIRVKYGIPLDKTVFIYGGNLGKPQGIPFLIECLKSQEKNEEAFFLIVGDGTEFSKLEAYFNEAKPQNMKLMKRLPKDDYDKMVGACDVGMIFLDHRFTIPNFPSRLLSCLAAGIPVLAATDTASDMGPIAEANGFGYWCESNDVEEFHSNVEKMLNADLTAMGKKGWEFLLREYTTEKAYRIIIQHFESDRGAQ